MFALVEFSSENVGRLRSLPRAGLGPCPNVNLSSYVKVKSLMVL